MNNPIHQLKEIYKHIKASRKLQMISIVSTSCLAVLIVILIWLHLSRFVSTDDAYINANIVQIAPQVSGQVVQLHVQNNQFVKAGALLFEIDPEPYKIALEKARAQLAIAQATWHNDQTHSERIIELVRRKSLSAQEHDDAIKALQIAAANYKLAKTALEQAELDLHNTRVYATTNGTISNMTLRSGNVVNTYQPLFALISNAQFWTDANFKETELQNVHVGQPAKVVVDMYPSHIFSGVVESISGGSDTAFSLLPAQNSTGNWIKITQRVPVKISILNVDSRYPLRIGTTATVTIDTKSNKQ